MYERICRKFGTENVERPGVIFSWGDRIFNPSNASITRELFAHEAVHGERQLAFNSEAGAEGSVLEWWDRYLGDPLFRLDEELRAHMAEYKASVKRHGHSPRALNNMAERLSGPLYGELVTMAQAKHAILTGVMTLDPMKNSVKEPA